MNKKILLIIIIYSVICWMVLKDEIIQYTQSEQVLINHLYKLEKDYPTGAKLSLKTNDEIKVICGGYGEYDDSYTLEGCYSLKHNTIYIKQSNSKEDLTHEYGHALRLSLRKICKEDVSWYAETSRLERWAEVFTKYYMWTLKDQCWIDAIENQLTK